MHAYKMHACKRCTPKGYHAYKIHAHMMHACKRCKDLQDACVTIKYTLIRCTSMRYTSMRYPSVAGVHLIILGRQVTDRHTTVLGGMLSCVMVPPNGSVTSDTSSYTQPLRRAGPMYCTHHIHESIFGALGISHAPRQCPQQHRPGHGEFLF